MLNLPEKIVGERVQLLRRPKSFANASETIKLVLQSKDELLPWLDWVAITSSAEDYYDYICHCEQAWEKGIEYHYMIALNDGTNIGSISLQNVDYDNNMAEIGYWIASRYSGNGYMQEAVKILEKAVFAKKINKLIIKTDALNLQSANVAKKCGYIMEGVLKKHQFCKTQNRYRDLIIFSKFKSDYIA